MTGSPPAQAPRARLFTALELAPEARTELIRWHAEQLSVVPGLRAVDPDGLHMTLCFLGSRPVEEIAPIIAACETMASHSPVVLSLGEALWLPPRRPGVVAVRLEDHDQEDPDQEGEAGAGGGGSQEAAPREAGPREAGPPGESRLTRLQSGLSRALQAGGWYEPPRRPFLSHVTVARVARSARVGAVALPGPAPLRFAALHMTLFHSHLGGPRAVYERLATVHLRGA